MTQVNAHQHLKTSDAAEEKQNPAQTLRLEASRYFLSDIKASSTGKHSIKSQFWRPKGSYSSTNEAGKRNISMSTVFVLPP